ncbi:leucine-rich repeat-containing protein 23-like [Neodiprion virginianus]|uniref:leucine-rich repeat-containing protein 23-like n=1 Tax=Neodiprion virginianus TaxID=2961670 RepID=UPI001EE73D9F|nr:leucine-rich repeat-containing protein 23-like [Neodiprion virginianus]
MSSEASNYSQSVEEPEDHPTFGGESGHWVSSREDGEEECCLTFDEAARGLCMLGKNDSGLKYSYLMLNVSEKGLTDISIIPTFRNVIFVNVSGNRLTRAALQVFSSMTYLLMIQADRNRITLPDLEPMVYLQVLTLNDNEISETSGIGHRLLECLELNRNRIRRLSLSPYVLENLRVLELRGNLLTTTNGIFFPSLVALYVAENRIEQFEGLVTLVNLKTLHARGNRISVLDGFATSCVKLSYVNLRENRIVRLAEFGKLRCLQSLKTIVVSQNPVVNALPDDEDEDDAAGYRVKLIAMIPNLLRIDKGVVSDDERKDAEALRRRIVQDGSGFSEIDEDSTSAKISNGGSVMDA